MGSFDVAIGKDGRVYATINVKTNITGYYTTYDDYGYADTEINDDPSFFDYDLVYNQTEDQWYITKVTKIKKLSGGNIQTIN